MKWINIGVKTMLKTRLTSRTLLVLCAIFIAGCGNNQKAAADDKNLWRQEIKCGDTHYQIMSECVASGSNFELNTCKKQTLTQMNTNKTIVLPNPSKADAKGIAKAGNTGRLFVISWLCEVKGSDQYLQLEYDVGTGRGEYDEYYESYDKNLSPLHLTNKQLSDELLMKFIGSKSISVKSIMPLQEETK
ncbi:MAG: hypothetical protein WC426_00090 [Sulfuriferula sp.]